MFDNSLARQCAMNLSAIAIRRPVFTTMLMGAVLVLDAMGLGTDLYPDVTFPMAGSGCQGCRGTY